MAGSSNSNFHKSKREKNDEYYTRYEDVEKELKHYTEHLVDKVVYCNCDAEWSNFWIYLSQNIVKLKIKKLIATHYNKDGRSYKLELKREDVLDTSTPPLFAIKTELEGNGDFRSPECIELLKEADIVITNPPFSLFREFIGQLVEYNKRFLVIGNFGAFTYNEIFNLFKENKVWYGISPRSMTFITSSGESKTVNSSWFTNLAHKRRSKTIKLDSSFANNEYHTFDNYDAINVDRVKDIPFDYKGNIGVPITFMTKFNPKQFELVDANEIIIGNKVRKKKHGLIADGKDASVNGKAKYARVVIKHID